jgi:hypothetical protein
MAARPCKFNTIHGSTEKIKFCCRARFPRLIPKTIRHRFYAVQRPKPAFHRRMLVTAMGICYLDISPCRKPGSDHPV